MCSESMTINEWAVIIAAGTKVLSKSGTYLASQSFIFPVPLIEIGSPVATAICWRSLEGDVVNNSRDGEHRTFAPVSMMIPSELSLDIEVSALRGRCLGLRGTFAPLSFWPTRKQQARRLSPFFWRCSHR